jgi:hypothetical protein
MPPVAKPRAPYLSERKPEIVVAAVPYAQRRVADLNVFELEAFENELLQVARTSA